MTSILAYEYFNPDTKQWEVYLGYDSMVSFNKTYISSRIAKGTVLANGKAMFASCGYSFMTKLLKKGKGLEWLPLPDIGREAIHADKFEHEDHAYCPQTTRELQRAVLSDYVTDKVVPAIQKNFKEANYGAKKEIVEDNGGEFAIAICGQLFWHSASLDHYSADTGIVALGSGGEVAYGAFAKGLEQKEPIDKAILSALKISSKYVSGVGGPFHIAKMVGNQVAYRLFDEKLNLMPITEALKYGAPKDYVVQS